jgi:hypothetical protein
MSGNSKGTALKTLASVKRSSDKINERILEALARLDEATTRITALGEIHIRLAKTIMDVLGIPQEAGPPLAFQEPMGAISSAQRAVTIASGLLRPIIRSIRETCGNIAQAINASKEEILKVTSDFDFTEMEILAREFGKDSDRVLGSDEQEAFRNKIKEWTYRLKNALSET